jgi:hypothetical protein
VFLLLLLLLLFCAADRADVLQQHPQEAGPPLPKLQQVTHKQQAEDA